MNTYKQITIHSADNKFVVLNYVSEFLAILDTRDELLLWIKEHMRETTHESR